MNYIYSTVNNLRERYTPVSHTSTFRETGQITPEEFLAAGQFLVDHFGTWKWADAEPQKNRFFPDTETQFLVTRNVPCHRRLNEDFAGDAGHEEAIVNDGEGFNDGAAGSSNDEDGWLRTGGLASSQALKARNVRSVDDSGNVADSTELDNDEIPDMEDEDDDDAIIRDTNAEGQNSGRRTYNIYITYSNAWRTPRLYLAGYNPDGTPLPPRAMMEDIMGDYKDKTVTLEDFPYYDGVKMASVHPCKHAPVMKTLMDRADAALEIQREKRRAGKAASGDLPSGMQGLVDELGRLDVKGAAREDKDEWEEVHEAEANAILVDHYLVVFIKFLASVTPGIDYDFTMSV